MTTTTGIVLAILLAAGCEKKKAPASDRSAKRSAAPRAVPRPSAARPRPLKPSAVNIAKSTRYDLYFSCNIARLRGSRLWTWVKTFPPIRKAIRQVNSLMDSDARKVLRGIGWDPFVQVDSLHGLVRVDADGSVGFAMLASGRFDTRKLFDRAVKLAKSKGVRIPVTRVRGKRALSGKENKLAIFAIQVSKNTVGMATGGLERLVASGVLSTANSRVTDMLRGADPKALLLGAYVGTGWGVKPPLDLPARLDRKRRVDAAHVQIKLHGKKLLVDVNWDMGSREGALYVVKAFKDSIAKLNRARVAPEELPEELKTPQVRFFLELLSTLRVGASGTFFNFSCALSIDQFKKFIRFLSRGGFVGQG